MVRILTLIGLGCAVLSGCATCKENRYEVVQSCHAEWAWRCVKPSRCEKDPYPRHFRTGWKAGYKNVALGGGGLLPPVPPQKYWSARFETAEGRKMISSWYCGYQMGAIQAEKRCEDSFHPVPTSCMVALVQNDCPSNEYTTTCHTPSCNGDTSSQPPQIEYSDPFPVAEETIIPAAPDPMISAPSAPEKIQPIEPEAAQKTQPVQETPPAVDELPDPKAEQAEPAPELRVFANAVDEPASTPQTVAPAKPLVEEHAAVEAKPSAESPPTSIGTSAAKLPGASAPLAAIANPQRQVQKKALPASDIPAPVSKLARTSQPATKSKSTSSTTTSAATTSSITHRLRAENSFLGFFDQKGKAKEQVAQSTRVNSPILFARNIKEISKRQPKSSVDARDFSAARNTPETTNEPSCEFVFKRARKTKDLRKILLVTTPRDSEDASKDTHIQRSDLRIVGPPQVAPLVRISGFPFKESKTQAR